MARNLLIVEDDKNTLSGLIEICMEEGFRVIGATSGEAAIEAMMGNKIDVAICDYKLPDIDGLIVSRKIKQINPETKIFLMTAFYLKSMDDVAQFCGVSKIFQKPVVVNDLLSSLISCLYQKI